MKALCTLAALTLAAPLWSILPQDTDAMEQANKGARSLRRTGSGQDFDRDTWRARLREPDLDLREQHFASLVRAAQRSRSAEDIRRVLANRRPDQALRLRVRTLDGEKQVLTWNPTKD